MGEQEGSHLGQVLGSNEPPGPYDGVRLRMIEAQVRAGVLQVTAECVQDEAAALVATGKRLLAAARRVRRRVTRGREHRRAA
jgi:hypothetical protein